MTENKILIDLKKHCIETEIRRQFEKDMAAYFRADEVHRRYLERRLTLLESALQKLDFADLRSRHHVLAGGTDAEVYLEQDKYGSVAIVINNDLRISSAHP